MKLNYLLPLGILCGIVSFGMNLAVSNADEQPKNPMTQTVIAEGVGATGDEALKDAFRNAVRQVVGAVVDTETMVKNDELIADKVLTYSGGFVKKYDEISKKEDKGLVRMKIKAQVESKSLVAKLKAANVKVKDVDGKGLFAEIVTELDREKDAVALLKKAFEGFPQNCMTINVVGEPKLIEKNDKNATVAVVVQVAPDAKAYSAFVKRLQPVLAKLVSGTSEKGEFMVKTSISKNGRYYSIGDSHITGHIFKWMPKAYVNYRIQDGKIVVALCTQSNQASNNLAYEYYLLDKSVKTALLNFAKGEYRSKLELVDRDGEVISTDKWELESDKTENAVFRANLLAIGGDSSLIDWKGRGWERAEEAAVLFFVSPTFFGYGRFFGHTPRLLFERKIMLTLDELKKVQKVKVELTSD